MASIFYSNRPAPYPFVSIPITCICALVNKDRMLDKLEHNPLDPVTDLGGINTPLKGCTGRKDISGQPVTDAGC